MNRRDTILIAVLVNAGLLAILFITAIVYDTDHPEELLESSPPIIAEASVPPYDKAKEYQAEEKSSNSSTQNSDEIDNSLKFYESPEKDTEDSDDKEEEEVPAAKPEVKTNLVSEETVEVTVKKGDSLDKIAKANGTTVNAIKKANSLVNEKLSIGQVLKVPVGKKKEKTVSVSPVAQAAESQYYVIKSGDNPWKIAKQFNVKYEDILKLNNIDEEKAKNLKAGDRIRIK